MAFYLNASVDEACSSSIILSSVLPFLHLFIVSLCVGLCPMALARSPHIIEANFGFQWRVSRAVNFG